MLCALFRFLNSLLIRVLKGRKIIILIIINFNFFSYEKIPSFWSPSSSPWSSSSRSWWLHVLMDCRRLIQLKSGLLVPCGRCPACLANNRQEWIFRIKEEYKASIFSIFVTLTYDDDNLPADGSVNKEDVVKFHKRLRKHFPPGDMRYYLVSEYGDRTHRPHYHGLYFFQHKYDTDFIYNIFLQSWNKGFIKFGDVEEGSIVYCTKYCLKHKIVPEGKKSTFRLISKMNGGIGISYLNKMSDYHLNSGNFKFVAADGRKCRMPRYYRDAINPYYGAAKYNPLHTRIEDRICEDRLETARKRFAEFARSRPRNSSSDLYKDFEEYQNRVRENRDELLIKHCKKQKL